MKRRAARAARREPPSILFWRSGPPPVRVLAALALLTGAAVLGSAVPLFLAFGALVVWDDVRRRKVANRVITAALAVSAVAYVGHGLFTAFARLGWIPSGSPLRLAVHVPGFFSAAALHMALSIVAGVGLWYARVWPAGDAKLYIAFSAMLPLLNDRLRGYPSFLFLALLVNTFMAAGAYILVLLMAEWGALLWEAYRGRFKLYRKLRAGAWLLRRAALSKWPDKHKAVIVGWNTFILFASLQFARRLLELPDLSVPGQIGVYIALYIVWDRLRSWFTRWDVTGLSFFVLSALLLPAAAAWRWEWVARLFSGFKMTVGWWFFLRFANLFLEVYLERTRTEAVKAEDLKPGMILSRSAWERLKSSLQDVGTEELPIKYADGLSEDELETVQGHLTREKGARVEVYRTRPFAFWIFFGSLWTLSFRENLAEWVKAWLQ